MENNIALNSGEELEGEIDEVCQLKENIQVKKSCGNKIFI
jgi:hypothetical protein